MSLALNDFVALISQMFWALLRVGGFFMTVPVLGSALVSRRIRIALTFAVALAVAPLLPPMPRLESIDASLIALAGVQLLAGIGLGFATTLFFQLFVVAGQYIGMQMGLGFAAMVDPGNGISVTVLSQFFLLLVSMTFIAIDGHLVLMQVLIEGFVRYPLGVEPGVASLSLAIARQGAWMFSGAVLVAFPAVISLLVVNLAFGVMTRASPQLNIFSLGFPFSLVFGLLIVWVLLRGWLPQFERLATEFLNWTAIWR